MIEFFTALFLLVITGVGVMLVSVIHRYRDDNEFLIARNGEMERYHFEEVVRLHTQLASARNERDDAHVVIEMLLEQLPPSGLRHVETHILSKDRISFIYKQDKSCSKVPSSSLSALVPASQPEQSQEPSSSPAS